VGVVHASDGSLIHRDPPGALRLRDVVNGQPRTTFVLLDAEVPEPARAFLPPR
jgi:hypothetical protein